MSEVLTVTQCAPNPTTVTTAQVRTRPSLARKRPAAAGLRPISDVSCPLLLLKYQKPLICSILFVSQKNKSPAFVLSSPLPLPAAEFKH